MQIKNLTCFLIIVVVCLQNFCMAQDTISKMTLYGDENVYQKKIHKEFVKVNKLYRTGIRHGLYYVYDIVDTSNKLSSEKDTLYFVNKHIYYVVSPSVYGKVSMIFIPYEGNMYAFIGLNCCKHKHVIEDVIFWVGKNFQNVDNSIFEKIKNYDIFHPNIAIDPQGKIPICERKCLHYSSHKHYHYKKPKVLYRSNHQL